jgi:hypothetical protein
VPDILFTERFVEQHCLFIRDRPGGGRGIGIAFDRHPDSNVDFDVRGTLWLPDSEGEPASIEFEFARVPRQESFFEMVARGVTLQGYVEAVLTRRLPGEMDLSLVPGFGWIVSGLTLRTPFVMREMVQIHDAGVRQRLRNGADLSDLVRGVGRSPVRDAWILHGIDETEFRVVRVQVDKAAASGS